MFIIVIFLLVSTTFINQPLINIDLPYGSQTEKMEKNQIVISIDQYKNLYLNGNRVHLNQLAGQLRKLSSDNNPSITLKADRSVPYGLAIEVIDTVKNSGFKKVIIQTQPK